MANITSFQSGLASSASTWTGGVVPVVGDKVTIQNSHVVELDGIYHWGDDTTTAVNINGILKWSRTVSSQLTVRGNLVGNSTGWADMGTESSPIPSNLTAKLILNESTSPAVAKYSGVFTGGFKAWGQDKTQYLKVIAATSDSVFTIATPSGWQVNDWVYLAHTSVTASGGYRSDCRIIQSIVDNGDGTSTITLNAATTYPIITNRYVVNLTRNVQVYGSLNQTYATYLNASAGTAATDNSIEIGPCEIRGMGFGSGSPATSTAFTTSATKDSQIKELKRFLVHNISSISGSTVTLCATGQFGTYSSVGLTGGNALTKTITEPVVVSHGITSMSQPVNRAFVLSGGESRSVTRPAIFGHGFASWALAGSIDSTFIDSLIVGGAMVACGEVNSGIKYSGGKNVGFRSTTVQGSGIQVSLSPLELTNFSFDTSATEPSSYTTEFSNFFKFQPSQNYQARYVACNFPSGWGFVRATSNLSSMSSRSFIDILSLGGDPTLNYRYTRGGVIRRDNSIKLRGTSSVSLACWYSTNAQTLTNTFAVPAGATIVVRGSSRVNSSYGSIPPSVSLSSSVTSTQTVVLPTTIDTWNDYSLTATNTAAYSVDFIVTYSATSTSDTENAIVWFDGVPHSPWVDVVRHYGYVFDSNPYRTVDTRLTLSESAALSLPVSVNHTSNIITVSGPLTNAEVFQALIADLCKTDNLTKAVHVQSSNGSVFTTSYSIVFSGSGSISGNYTDANGTSVEITAPSLISGSRVQIYNEDSNMELYNSVLSSSGLVFKTNYTSPHVIRLRADHSTKLPLETIGVLSSNGLTFLDVQQEDTVYNSIGIDGSTITEFTSDGPNVQVDINDIDGISSVQRLYAWISYYQTTASGIASNFFGAITALDSVNFIVDQSLVDLKLDNISTQPLRVIGGYISRKDGSSIIASSSYSIQMDPGKAYLAPGSVSVDNTAIANAVRSELSLELSRIDDTISSRSTLTVLDIPTGLSAENVWEYSDRTLTVTTGLTPAQETKLDNIKSKTDNLPIEPADQLTLDQIQTKIDAIL